MSIVDHPAAVAAFVDRAGRVHCAVPHRRIAVRRGEVSQAVTAKRDDVMRLASSIADRLHAAYGPVNIQIFACTDGALRATEINPRFSGGYPLAERAGAHFADWLIQEAAGEALGTVCTNWQDGVSMSRFNTEVFLMPAGSRCRRSPSGRRVAVRKQDALRRFASYQLFVFDLDDTLILERDYVHSGFQTVGRHLWRSRGLDGFAEEAWRLFLFPHGPSTRGL